MFHIVFDPNGAGLLTAAMDLDETLDGETLLISDDYSVGPIKDLFSEEGLTERNKWWNDIRADQKESASLTGENGDAARLRKILLRMEEEEFEQIWIWIAPNVKDVSGYYWLIAQLKDFSGRVYIISLNNLPFISEKGAVFYPVTLSEIPSREFVKAKKLARPVSSAEFETDPEEWLRLAAENKNLRTLEGGKKILQQPDDYYDKAVLNFLLPVFQKITRLIQQFLLKHPEKINESFLLWRLKQLLSSGDAEQQGEMVKVSVKEANQING